MTAQSTSSRYVLLFWAAGTTGKYPICSGTSDERGESEVNQGFWSSFSWQLCNKSGWCWLRCFFLLIDDLFTIFPGSIWGTLWRCSFINMGNWNAERFLSCIYILRGLEIWGACVFGCVTSDTCSLICMNIIHPELLLRSKNQLSASAKTGCWHPELEPSKHCAFFKTLGLHPSLGVATESNTGFSLNSFW